MAESIGSVSVDVVPNARQFWEKFKAQTTTGAVDAGRTSGNNFQRGFNEATRGGVNVKVNADTAEAEAQVAALRRQLDTLDKSKPGGSLLTYLLPLAPAIIPIAGAAAAGGAALAAMGLVGVLAVKGIKQEMASGSAEGQQYAAGLAELKGYLSDLEAVAAGGVLDGFEKSLASVKQELPGLATEVAASSQELGDIGSKVIGGVVGGVGNFAPVINDVLGIVDRLAGTFESWASGPGGDKFATTLLNTFDEVAPVLGDLAQTAVQLVQAFAPAGGGALSEIDLFSQLVNMMPVSILKLATTAYIAFRTAVAVTTGIKAATVALEGFAAAEGTAAAATGVRGLAGGLATGLARFSPYIAGAVAADFAIQSLVKTNNSWSTSNNTAQRTIGNIGTELSDLAHFKLGSFLTGADVEKNLNFRDLRNTIQQGLDMYSTIQDETAQVLGPNGLAKLAPYATKNFGEIGTAVEAFFTQLSTGHTPLSQSSAGFTDLAKSLATAAAGEQKYLTQGKDTGKQLNGVAIYTGTWSAALQEADGSISGATAIIADHIQALSDDQSTMGGVTVEQKNLIDAVSSAATKYKLTSDQLDTYASILGVTADQLAEGSVSQDEFDREIGILTKDIDLGSTAFIGLTDAIAAFAAGADTAATRGALIGQILKASNGDTLAYANTMVTAAQANQQFVTDLADVKKGVVNWKTGVIDFHNAAAAPLLSDLQKMQDGAVGAAAAVYQHETALGKSSAASDAFNTYVNDTSGALKSELVQMGYSTQEAGKLADQYFSIKNSGDLKKQIELIGKDDVATTLKDILADLDIIAGKKIIVPPITPPSTQPVTDFVSTVNSIIGGINTPKIPSVPTTGLGSLVGAHAAGGGVADGWFTVGEEGGSRGWELGHKQGSSVQIFSNAQSRNIMGTSSLPGYAGGSGESGGFTGVDYTSTAQKKATSSASSKVKVTVDWSDLQDFLRSLPTYVATAASAVNDQFNSLISKVSQAGGSTSLVSRLKSENKQLLGLINEREQVEKRLSTAQNSLNAITDRYNSLKSTAAQGVLGTFDISKAGTQGTSTPFASGVSGVVTSTSSNAVTASSILAELTSKVADARKFNTDIQALAKRGLGQSFLQQFVQAGPSALPQVEALMKATKSQLSALNSGEYALSAAGNSLGTSVANDLYGAGKQAAQGLVDGLKAKDKDLTKAITHLGDLMVNEIKSKLKIHSPSRVFHDLGSFTGQGLVNGMVSQFPAVRNAAKSMANHATPASQAGEWASAASVAGSGGPLIGQVVQRENESGTALASRVANQLIFASQR